MSAIFLYGTLLDAEHLSIVAGADVVAVRAELAGFGVFHAGTDHYPRLAEAEGTIEGLLIEAGEARARLDFYEGGYGYGMRQVVVATADGPREAEVYWPGEDVPAPGAPWSLADWQTRWGVLTHHVAREAMGFYGEITASELVARMPVLRARAQARVLAAAEGAPRALKPAPAGTVEIVQETTPYSGFFGVSEYKLSYPLFAGGRSPTVVRATFLSADAVIVLPYDPVRDRVHLIEQFRMGPMARGDAYPFMVEAVAGRIDPGETPEGAAQREGREEAGLAFSELHLVSRSYPSPGAMTEYFHIYVGITDLPDDVDQLGGLETEDEDIRTHVLPYQEFEKLLDAHAFRVGPLELAAHWLVRHRARLRGTVADGA
ncbi:MAG: gamma-glutamylcyclotransferase [Pseudomonadota bacterium]